MFRLLFINVLFLFMPLYSCNILYEDQNYCKSAIIEISESLSDVSTCLMVNSGPKSTCLKCREKYKSFMEKSKIVREDIYAPNGKLCLDAIEKVDKYKVVSTIIKNISQTWNNSNCEFCFMNSSATDYKENLKVFINKHETLINCLQSFTNSNVSLCDGTDFPPNNTTKNVAGCTKCRGFYVDLLKTYETLQEGGINSVCGDVENLFQCAKIAVEQYFRCPLESVDFLNAWPLIAVFAATLLFYSCSTICHDKHHIEIYNQSRVMACFGPADLNSIFGASTNSHFVTANSHHQHPPPYLPHLPPSSSSIAPCNPNYESDHDGSLENSIGSTHISLDGPSACLAVPVTNTHNNKFLSIQN